jgi:hypothetical protein
MIGVCPSRPSAVCRLQSHDFSDQPRRGSIRKDLKDTEKIVSAVNQFDPDESWKKVE